MGVTIFPHGTMGSHRQVPPGPRPHRPRLGWCSRWPRSPRCTALPPPRLGRVGPGSIRARSGLDRRTGGPPRWTGGQVEDSRTKGLVRYQDSELQQFENNDVGPFKGY